ncbi:MAG: hypothetical protein II710_03130 [Clostridia bacterium]|nr:hypothetical protein [Clostridia bacterium]MBQ3927618.1 hypothetical protein [Clostridia bacterium]MBQ7727207.1 hypothetical protein [Clostridia bacterium]
MDEMIELLKDIKELLNSVLVSLDRLNDSQEKTTDLLGEIVNENNNDELVEAVDNVNDTVNEILSVLEGEE